MSETEAPQVIYDLRREVSKLRAMATIVSDLDRCEHGRHEGDVCSSCGGPSKGNPCVNWAWTDPEWESGGYRDVGHSHVRIAAHLDEDIPPRLVGFTMGAKPIVDPGRDKRHDPTAWVSP